MSRGTATTVVEGLWRGGMVRRGGVLRKVPSAWKTRVLDLGRGPQKAITIPWGDVATAWHSTGIPNIEVYMVAPTATRVAAKLLRPLGWLVGTHLVQRFLKKRIHAGPAGPTEEDAAGNRAVSLLRGPDGYTFTVLAALRVLERVLAGQAPAGFQTPALAYGPDLVLDVEGVERIDL
jgi:short subunit dehydrogenase-like uncharacterized protein